MTGARAVIAAAVILLGVSACSSDDPEPIVAPTPSSSAPSDPSTSPVAGSLGPEETVRAWVDAQNAALQTGDTAGLDSFSAGDCRGCDDFVLSIRQVYEDGGHFATDGWTVVAAKQKPNSTDPIVVDVAVSIAGGKTVAKAGAEPVVYGEEKRVMQFELVTVDDRLLVSFVGFVQ